MEESLFGIAMHRFTMIYSFNDLRRRSRVNSNTLNIHQSRLEFYPWSEFLGLVESRNEVSQLLMLNPRARYFGVPKTLELGIITTTGVTM
jgi:hypothetical protein